MITTLSSYKISAAGNKYFTTSFLDRQLIITINPHFKPSKEKNKKTAQPCWLLHLQQDKGSQKYSGTGAAWEMWRKDGRCYQGNILIDDIKYLVDIRRLGTKEEVLFELQLTPTGELELNNL